MESDYDLLGMLVKNSQKDWLISFKKSQKVDF